ncbi:MAG TPA: hypothetical protein VNO30_42175 [Kofleriaceae bacterium]|nr:hypothetical protein [Kofleriaceae bacterium]
MSPASRGAARALLAAGALAAGSGACDRRPPLASCDDDLRGVYVAGGQRWMILDGGAELEAYPLFPDVAPVPGLEVAPRVLGFQRTPGGIHGNVRRRYMRGAQACVGRAPAHVTACAGEALQLVLADPAPPLAWPDAPEQACTWSSPSTHVERWVRE